MLTPIKRFIDTPILSLQTGAEIARTSDVIIDPRQLKIIAFRVAGNNLDYAESVLYPEDIREISNIGIIVDSSDKLMSTEGLVRLQEVIDFGFVLDGIRVEDDRHKKIGSVHDYALDPDSFIIQQLYVKPPLVRSLTLTTHIIHRSQIASINNKRIVVKSPTIPEKEPLKSTVQATFTNPFRAPAPTQPESKEL
jgi:uncharacterized protein YrrD